MTGLELVARNLNCIFKDNICVSVVRICIYLDRVLIGNVVGQKHV